MGEYEGKVVYVFLRAGFSFWLRLEGRDGDVMRWVGRFVGCMLLLSALWQEKRDGGI